MKLQFYLAFLLLAVSSEIVFAKAKASKKAKEVDPNECEGSQHFHVELEQFYVHCVSF